MSEWQHVPLKDITLKIGSGATPTGGSGAYKTSGISLIRSQNVLDYSFTNSGLAFIDDDQAYALRNVIVEPNDVLLNITGDSVARCCSAPLESLPARVNQHVAILRSNPQYLNSNFLKYILISMKEELLSLSEIGGTRNALTKRMLEDLKLFVPPLSEQKAIASVLSSLDDKIDLLHRQNKTLESMAETLFRQWFVERVQDDWEETELGNLVSVKRGGSPRPIQNYLSDTGYRWLKISDVTNVESPYIFKIKEHIKEEGLPKTTLINAGQLVLSNSATPGIPKIVMKDTCIHDGWLYFPNSKLTKEFLYLLFNHIRPELLQLGNGSIFTNLKTEILKNFLIKKPDSITLDRFQNIVSPLFEKLLRNAEQINCLEKLRDTLLPKLMSGEVRVQYAEEAISSIA